MNSIGIIFDIDGVVTLPIKIERQISIPDAELFLQINKLSSKGVSINFITGRAFPWFETFILPQLNFLDNEFNCFFEYGLVSYKNQIKSISKTGKSFRKNYYKTILSKIANESLLAGVTFKKNKTYVDYPDHGSLWVETKNCMISILSNKNISTLEVQKIVEKSIEPQKKEFRFLKHHLGCDILPKGWSKEKGAIEVKKLASSKIKSWLIFGDNESDIEMCKPFKDVEYIDTKIGASKKTKEVLMEKFSHLSNNL